MNTLCSKFRTSTSDRERSKMNLASYVRELTKEPANADSANANMRNKLPAPRRKLFYNQRKEEI